MIQGLFLDRIDAETRGASVGGEHHPIALPTTHEAKPTLALVKFAEAWADITLNATVFEPVPMAARNTFQLFGTHHGAPCAALKGTPRPCHSNTHFRVGRASIADHCIPHPWKG
jgi:hypothetical protein